MCAICRRYICPSACPSFLGESAELGKRLFILPAHEYLKSYPLRVVVVLSADLIQHSVLAVERHILENELEISIHQKLVGAVMNQVVIHSALVVIEAEGKRTLVKNVEGIKRILVLDSIVYRYIASDGDLELVYARNYYEIVREEVALVGVIVF